MFYGYYYITPVQGFIHSMCGAQTVVAKQAFPSSVSLIFLSKYFRCSSHTNRSCYSTAATEPLGQSWRPYAARCTISAPLYSKHSPPRTLHHIHGQANALRYARDKAKRHAQALEERQVFAAREVLKAQHIRILREQVGVVCMKSFIRGYHACG